MISIQGVTFTYPGSNAPVLRDLNLEVPQGAFTALVGNNGSGKTSLCKLLTGLIPHFFEGEISGTVTVDGQNTFETRVSELSRHVGYVYQDFENQLLKPKVIDDVAFGPLNFGMADYHVRAATALESLGLSDLGDRIIWELSGGEQHLIALAGALALEPEIVVVDEPVSQLDPVNAAAIYDKLTYLNKELGKTIIVIEHHPDFIGTYCDHVILLNEGSVIWHRPVRDALTRIEELERHEVYSPQVTRIAHRIDSRNGEGTTPPPINLQESVAYFKPYLESTAGSRQYVDDKLQTDTSEPIVTFQDVSHCYKLLDGSTTYVLGDINLSLYGKDRVALVGANGAGKSTLMRLISGLEKPAQGTVQVMGIDTRQTTPEDLADHVAFIYQDPQQMFIEDSIRGDVAYYLRARRVQEAEEIVSKAIEDFRLVEIEGRDGRLLSGGQMRRASLAIGACMRPKIMLLDEPTSSLDMANRRQIMLMLDRLEEWVQTVVIATHDMELVAEWAHRVIVLQHGKVLADDITENIFGDPELIQQARIRPPQVVQLCNALDVHPVHLSVDSFVDALSRRDRPTC